MRAEQRETLPAELKSEPSTPPSRPIAEIRRLGEEIYVSDIERLVDDDHIGEVCAIDVDSGEWAIGEDNLEASARLRKKRPNAHNIWPLRIGPWASYKIAPSPRTPLPVYRDSADRAKDEPMSDEERGALRATLLAGSSRPPSRSTEEIARLGDEIYKKNIRHLVEKDHVGEICVIDVETGEWAVGEDGGVAVGLLRWKHPDAHSVWSLRVGVGALHRFGWGAIRRSPQ